MKKIFLFVLLSCNFAFAENSSESSKNQSNKDACRGPAFDQLKAFGVNPNIKRTEKKDYSGYEKNIKKHQEDFQDAHNRTQAIGRMLKRYPSDTAQLPILKEKMRTAEAGFKAEIQKFCAVDAFLCKSKQLKKRDVQENIYIVGYEKFEDLQTKNAEVKEERRLASVTAPVISDDFKGIKSQQETIIRHYQKVLDGLNYSREEKQEAKIAIANAQSLLAAGYKNKNTPAASEKVTKNSNFRRVKIYTGKNGRVDFYAVSENENSDNPDLLVSLKDDCSLRSVSIGEGKTATELNVDTCKLDSPPFGSHYKATACRMLKDQGSLTERAPSSSGLPEDFIPDAVQPNSSDGTR